MISPEKRHSKRNWEPFGLESGKKCKNPKNRNKFFSKKGQIREKNQFSTFLGP